MRSLDVKGALRRRWYLLVAGLLATAGLAGVAVNLVGSTHEIKSSVLLLPPSTSVVGYPDPEAPGNPFLRLDGMDPAVSVLVTSLTSKEVSDQILKDTPDGDYEVYQDPLSQAPIIVVAATAATSDQAELIRDRVTDLLPTTLNSLQSEAGVRPKARITATDLVIDPRATEVWRQLIRLLILIIGGGLVGTLLFLGVVDAIARSRRESKQRRALVAESGEPPTPDEAGQEVDPQVVEPEDVEAEDAEADDARPVAAVDGVPTEPELPKASVRPKQQDMRATTTRQLSKRNKRNRKSRSG